MTFHHGYSWDELESKMPFEVDLIAHQIKQYISKESGETPAADSAVWHPPGIDRDASKNFHGGT